MWAVAPSSYLYDLPWDEQPIVQVVDPRLIAVPGAFMPAGVTVGQNGVPISADGTSMQDASSTQAVAGPVGEMGWPERHRRPGFLSRRAGFLEPHVPGLTDQRIQFDEGPPWPSKSYHVPGWYSRSDKGKVALLRKYAKEYGRDPRLRAFTINHVLRPAGVIQESRQYEAQARAILSWVQSNIAYLNEPSELIQGPWQTLKAKYGDCDDMALLMGAMAESIALPWRLTLAGKHKLTGKGVRWREGERFPRGVNFFHIYVTFGWPPFKPTHWISAEPTMRVPLGHDVVAHGVPQGLPGLSGLGTFGQAEPGTSPMAAHLPGQMIVTGATPIYPRLREVLVENFGGGLSSWVVKVIVALAIAIPVQLITLKVLKSRGTRRLFRL